MTDRRERPLSDDQIDSLRGVRVLVICEPRSLAPNHRVCFPDAEHLQA